VEGQAGVCQWLQTVEAKSGEHYRIAIKGALEVTEKLNAGVILSEAKNLS
jgi:hypothetical protein